MRTERPALSSALSAGTRAHRFLLEPVFKSAGYALVGKICVKSAWRAPGRAPPS